MDTRLESGTPIISPTSPTTDPVSETSTPETLPNQDSEVSPSSPSSPPEVSSSPPSLHEDKEAPSNSSTSTRSSFIKRRLRLWRRNRDGSADYDDSTSAADQQASPQDAPSDALTEEDRKREITKIKWKRDRLNTELNMLAQWSQDKQRHIRRLERHLRRNLREYALEQEQEGQEAEEEGGEEEEGEEDYGMEEMNEETDDGLLSPEGMRSPEGSMSPRELRSPRKTRARRNSDSSKVSQSSPSSAPADPESQEASPERVVTFSEVTVTVSPPPPTDDSSTPAADSAAASSSGTETSPTESAAADASAETKEDDSNSPDSKEEESSGSQTTASSSRRTSIDVRTENHVGKDIESGLDSSSSDDDSSEESSQSSDEEVHPTTYRDVVVLSNTSGGSVQIKAGNLGVIISDYSDIFSSFDPRPYSERNLSSDFLEEVNRYATSRAMKQQEHSVKNSHSRLLKILVPANSRNALIEDEISERIRNYFSSVARRHVFKLIRKFIISSIMLTVGLILLVLNGWLYDEYPDEGFFMSMLITTSGPAAWFFAWSGADAMLWGTIENVKGLRFWRKVSKLEVQFWGYLDVDETIGKPVTDSSGPLSVVTSSTPMLSTSPAQEQNASISA